MNKVKIDQNQLHVVYYRYIYLIILENFQGVSLAKEHPQHLRDKYKFPGLRIRHKKPRTQWPRFEFDGMDKKLIKIPHYNSLFDQNLAGHFDKAKLHTHLHKMRLVIYKDIIYRSTKTGKY